MALRASVSVIARRRKSVSVPHERCVVKSYAEVRVVCVVAMSMSFGSQASFHNISACDLGVKLHSHNI